MSGSRTIGSFVDDELNSNTDEDEFEIILAESQLEHKDKNMDLSRKKDEQEQPPPVPPRVKIEPDPQHTFQNHLASSKTAELEVETSSSDEQQPAKSAEKKISKKLNSGFEENTVRRETEQTVSEQFQASQTECEILRNQVLELRQNLHDAQDFIFSMQPRQQRITESDAATEFNSLCGSVEEWVQTKLGDALEDMTVIKERGPLGQPAKFVLSMIPPAGKEAFKYPETDEYNVIALIMRYLADWILARDFYCPVEKGATEFLATIEKSMRNLEPRRDLISCRTWRSETYIALANRHEFANYHEKYRDTCTSDLTTLLRIFLPHADKKSLRSSIESAIVDPALALAHKLHLSIDKYSIIWTPHHTSKYEQRRSMPQELSQFECVDIISGRTVKFPTKGQHLKYMFDVTPGLLLETVKTDFYAEPKILKRPRVLVAAMKEELGYFNPPTPRSGEPVTLLGWMDERLHQKQSSLFRHM